MRRVKKISSKVGLETGMGEGSVLSPNFFLMGITDISVVAHRVLLNPACLTTITLSPSSLRPSMQMILMGSLPSNKVSWAGGLPPQEVHDNQVCVYECQDVLGGGQGDTQKPVP